MLKESPAKLRVVFDANVFIAALLTEGLSNILYVMSSRGEFHLIISPEIIVELKNKLASKKFGLNSFSIDEFVAQITSFATLVRLEEKVTIVKSDPSDNKIIETAIAGDANLIVTYDKHLLKLKKYQNIGVVHPKTLTWIIPDSLT